MGSNGQTLPTGQPPPVTVRLYVRAPVASDSTAAIDRLGALTIDDRLEGYDVETLRGDVLLAEDEEADLPTPLERWQRIVAWTSDDLAAAIDVETNTTRTGRRVRTVSPPELVAAVRVEGDLACVFPCSDGERTWTVEDFLDDYETGRDLPVGRQRDRQLA